MASAIWLSAAEAAAMWRSIDVPGLDTAFVLAFRSQCEEEFEHRL
jgi:hypothetical protein